MVLEKLAVGSTAEVFKVKRTSDNTIYALKKIRLTDENLVFAA